MEHEGLVRAVKVLTDSGLSIAELITLNEICRILPITLTYGMCLKVHVLCVLINYASQQKQVVVPCQ